MKPLIDLATVETSECSCAGCRGMCKIPCWPTVAEAKAIIAAGLGNRLARDRWEPKPALLSCAEKGGEGMSMSWGRSGGCTFQRQDGLCELHILGLKPIEGKHANHENRNAYEVHQSIAATWDTDEGRALVNEWETIRFGGAA